MSHVNPWYNLSDAQIVRILLEMAANDDVNRLQETIRSIDPAFFDLVGKWNGLERTPLMVAATHGSLGIVHLLLSSCRIQVNRSCGHEMVTALHCAASSGSVKAYYVVKRLLDAGADPDKANLYGHLPRDVVVAPPRMMNSLRNMLTMDTSPVSHARDELFLQAYKVYECAVEGPHQQERCAFFHRGVGDRRRNPRQYSYSINQCWNGGGVCPQGDNCLFSHGANESNFHPNRFKTSLCHNAAACLDMACFRAHSQRERRFLYSARWMRLPVMQLNEDQQWIFLNAARFTKYFFRRFPANFWPR